MGLRVSEPGALAALLERLPPGWKPASARTVERLYSLVVGGNGDGRVRRLNVLYGDAERLARTRQLDEALELFASDVQLYVAETARRRVFVHAGVVGWRGRAIVMPGRSFSGKSTLTAALVRAGATYFSDEYAVLDRGGRVHPFPKPLALRPEGSTRQDPGLARDFGVSAPVKSLSVGLVVVSEYEPSVKRWRPRRLSAGEGILELLRHTVSARRAPEAALATLEQVTAKATVVKGRRGDADETARAILEWAAAEATPRRP